MKNKFIFLPVDGFCCRVDVCRTVYYRPFQPTAMNDRACDYILRCCCDRDIDQAVTVCLCAAVALHVFPDHFYFSESELCLIYVYSCFKYKYGGVSVIFTSTAYHQSGVPEWSS